MEKIKILCGFDLPEFDKKLKEKLREVGVDATIHAKLTKTKIREYVDTNPDCNVVILRERVGMSAYTAEEITQLTDKRDVNIIIVLNGRHYGTEFMKTLFIGGVRNAIFQHGANGGASVSDIVSLILQKRSLKDTREYYGIENKKMDLGFLDDGDYIDYYQELHKEGTSIIKNYIDICAKLSPQHIADFTRRLTEDDRDSLIGYEEFHVVMQLLKEFGIDMKIKKPKKVVIGLTVPQEITCRDSEPVASHGASAEENEVVEANKKEEASEHKETATAAVEEDLKDMNDFSVNEMVAMLNKPDEESDSDSSETFDNLSITEMMAMLNATHPDGESKDGVSEATDNEDAMEREVAEIVEKLIKEVDKAVEEAEKGKVEEKKEQQAIQEEYKAEEEHLNKAKKEEKRKQIVQEDTDVSDGDDEDNDGADYILDSGDKQFSKAFIVILAIFVLIAILLLFCKPSFENLSFHGGESIINEMGNQELF